MANPQYTNVNEEELFVDGTSTQGIKNGLVLDEGSEKYWSDGSPVISLFPVANQQTGKFLLLFD